MSDNNTNIGREYLNHVFPNESDNLIRGMEILRDELETPGQSIYRLGNRISELEGRISELEALINRMSFEERTGIKIVNEININPHTYHKYNREVHRRKKADNFYSGDNIFAPVVGYTPNGAAIKEIIYPGIGTYNFISNS